MRPVDHIVVWYLAFVGAVTHLLAFTKTGLTHLGKFIKWFRRWRADLWPTSSTAVDKSP